MNAVSSRSTLPNLFNEIDKYIKKQIMRQTNAMRDEKIKVDCFIQGNSSMGLLTGKISSWALDRIYQELLKTVAEDEEPVLPIEKCFDCEIKSFNLPCKHEVAHPASKLHDKIRLEIVGRRCLLKQEPQVDEIPQNSSMERIIHTDTAYQRREEDNAAMISSAMAKLQLLFRKCETTSEVFSLCQELNNVGEKLEKTMHESRNTSIEFPEHEQVSRIGRPSKERVYLAYRADANKKRKKIEDATDRFELPKRKIPKLEEKLTTKKIEDCSANSESTAVSLGLDAKDFYVDQLLPIDGGFIKKLNNSGQGDCGFKALAQQMYHPEDETKHNIGVFQYEACCKILSTPHQWFTTPECAQVAADIFGRPIAEYTSEVFQGAGCRTFLPLLEFIPSPNKINPGPSVLVYGYL
ncbi:unnamed protein product [Mucor circinelloides]